MVCKTILVEFLSGIDVSVSNKRRSVLLSSDSIMTDSEDSYDTVMQIYIYHVQQQAIFSKNVMP